MRYPTSEKAEIIRLVEGSHLPARRTLDKLGIPRATFYRGYDRHLTSGVEALADHRSRPDLERQVAAFVEHDNHARYHESLAT